jgi:hypothetical protein
VQKSAKNQHRSSVVGRDLRTFSAATATTVAIVVALLFFFHRSFDIGIPVVELVSSS